MLHRPVKRSKLLGFQPFEGILYASAKKINFTGPLHPTILQLFQLLGELTVFSENILKDKSPQLELEVGTHGYSSNLDTKCIFTYL